MLGVRPAPVLPTTRHYFASQFRVFVHEVGFSTRPDLTKLPPGMHYAVKSCVNLDPLIEDIRGLLLRCISDTPEVPAGNVRGMLPRSMAGYHVGGDFTASERDHLYELGINPIISRNGRACLMGQKVITKRGFIANLVSYPFMQIVHGIEEGFLNSIESPFCITLKDFKDDDDVTRWCSENATGDFFCTFETALGKRKTAYAFFQDQRDAELFKLFFY